MRRAAGAGAGAAMLVRVVLLAACSGPSSQLGAHRVSDDVSPAVMLSAHDGTVSVAEDATGASAIE
ncbi:hypothetical protein E3T35_18020 [Cryobacterium sp. TMT1-2-2]|uniref:hypothetical protein n=1 Tax=Cryobacterium sp. TMT1-2-2 TaxID=1259233 RepID=UPI00106D78D8|nr:hypothetical protein [Cryobacterium sp. TMT1-2-2]TFD07914.1 hypothetical protein E3T35_18020 [Cryobacterium sp. TMT1-2-2]